MRITAFVLMFVCTLLIGWMPVLAQTQGMPAVQSGYHDMQATRGHADASDHQHHSDCAPPANGCGNSHKMVHPMLCAACFALPVSGFPPERIAMERSRPASPSVQALVAVSLQPVSPPPKG